MKKTINRNPVIRRFFFLAKDIILLSKQAFATFRRFRLWVGITSWFRYLFLSKILRKLKFYSVDTGEIAKETIQHNYKGLSLFSIGAFSGYRPARLFNIINSIESIDRKNSRVLIIGPRAESEIFIARSHGFRQKNIRCLDLISYSNLVDLGDMHHMPYENDSFDVIVLGWVLAYSNDPQRACKEVIRVARENAIVITGIQYMAISVEEIKKRVGYTPGASERIDSNEKVLGYFKGHVKQVIYNHDVTDVCPEKTSDLILCIRINK